MAATSYTYSIQNDFPNHIVATDRLIQEIQSSAITIAVDYINTSEDDCIIFFKDELSLGNQSILSSLVSAHTGTPLYIPPPTKADGTPIVELSVKQNDGVPKVAIAPNVGDEIIFATHNFCDKCTWFGESVRVNNEILSDQGDGYTFLSVNQYWIDMISGRVQNDSVHISNQMQLNPGDPHGYQVVVTVDGYEKTMREPFMASGGDYEVYWEDGYIKSFENWGGKTVVASYSKATNSTFILCPLPGTILNITAAEADFSTDVIINDIIEYSVWGYASTFAPQLGLPVGTKIPLSNIKYKKLNQIYNEAIGSYPLVQVTGAHPDDLLLDLKEFRRRSRGMKQYVQSIPFRYATSRTLRSSLGLELRVKLTHDQVFDGELTSLTLYCLVDEE